MRKLLVILLAALLVAGAIIAPLAGAFAHSQLEASKPVDGAELSDPPAEIVLEFNEPVRKNFGQVQVTGPDERTYADGEVEVTSSTATQQLSELKQQGRYQVGWRVISADGHPVSGEFTFWVGEKGAAGSLASEQASTDNQPPVLWLVVGGALLLIVVIVVGLLVVRKPGKRGGQGQVE